MKILHLVNAYPTENIPEFGIFTKEQIESLQNESVLNTSLFFINAREKGFLEYLRVIPALFRSIKKNDIIHCFHGYTFLLAFFLAPRKKLLVSFLNSIEKEYVGNYRFLSKPTIFLTKVLCKRKNIFKIFKDKIPPYFASDDRSYYLPNGVNFDNFYEIEETVAKNALSLDKSKQYVLFVSSRDLTRRQKRYDIFAKTLDILKTKYGMYNVEELIMSGIPRNRVIYYFNAASLHLLTSEFEGSPNSVKESIACNTPVVSTPVGNVKDMIGNIEGCYVSESFEASELAELSFMALNTKRFCGREGLKKNMLDEGSIKEKLLNIYNNINKYQ